MLLDPAPNAGGTKGTTLNHLGFQVPNLRLAIDRVKAAGFPMVTREEITAVPPEAVKDDMAFNPFMEAFVAMTMGPEGTKIELVENPGLTVSDCGSPSAFLQPGAGRDAGLVRGVV